MTFLKKLAKKLFQYEAKLILRKYKPKVIAITGSVGKTLTKEAIYLVLSKKFFIRKAIIYHGKEGCPMRKLLPRAHIFGK